MYSIYTHIRVYAHKCVSVYASVTLKRQWDKAQRTLENLTAWQPLADYSCDATLITVEK